MGKSKEKIIGDQVYRDYFPFWQSNNLNFQSDMTEFNNLIALACNRFRWVNLYPGMNERYLELCFIRQGCVCAFEPKEVPGEIWNLQGSMAAYLPDIYGNPTMMIALGENGNSRTLAAGEFVAGWNNRLRLPDWLALQLYARRISNVDRTIDTNLEQQKMPYVIECPESLEQAVKNMVTNMVGNEPYIVSTTGSFADANPEGIHIKILGTPVPNNSVQNFQARQALKNIARTYLGIDNNEIEKPERLVVGEVNQNNDEIAIRRNDYLTARREFCQECNAKWGGDMQVYWRSDFETDNFDLLTNLKQQAIVQNGGNPNAANPS